MGVELLKIVIKMRKGVIFTIRCCFRSVCNHPFLVGMLCFLIYMYRSSPFLFSLLVSASPVLICTAVLLGTLLSFGQPNIPEIEIEEKTTHEAVPLKTGLSKDTSVVEQNESYYVERYSEKRRDEMEQSSASNLGEICSSDVTAPLMEDSSRVGKLENGEIWEANGELGDKIHKQKTEWKEERLSDGEVVSNYYPSVRKANHEHSDDEKSVADSFDSERVNVDCLDSPPHSPWKQVKDHDDEDEEEEEEEEEEEDALDSGSDRAESSSPDASMADIMPMLDELHPLLDEEAEQPVQMSRDSSHAPSEHSTESSTSSNEFVDEIENHDDFEVAEDENEEEDDDDDAQGDKEEQTKSAITWTEEDQKNLMDLGSSEIERNQRLENLILRRRTRKNMSMVPEINLIDLESSDLPFNVASISTTRQNPFDLPHDDNPIPGSAPSILLPRHNPFDIPYDYTNEEKPNITGDGFREELATLQSREPFFRRHESFNVGPSVFAPNRQDVKFRPYFVPERMVPEESSYSPFQRQSSEMSDSKVSSVPETESVGSVEDLEYQKLPEEDNNPRELEAISRMEDAIEECPSGDDVPREPELIISEMEHVGHGSQSSGEEEEESLEVGPIEKSDVEFKFQSHDVEDHYEIGSAERHSRGSSSSSLSEVSEKLSMLNGRRDEVAEEQDISVQTTVESTDLSTLVDDVPHKEPVYDSSPHSVRKNLSSCSSSSDVHAESDQSLPPVLVKRTVSFIEKETEIEEIEKDIHSKNDILPEPLMLHPADEHESADVNSVSYGVDQRSESQGASVVDNNIIPSKSHDEASLNEDTMDLHAQDQVPASSSDFNIHAMVKSCDDNNLSQSEKEKHLLIPERESIVGAPPVESQLEEDHSIDKGETVSSSNSDADYQEANEKLISTPSAGRSTPLFYDIRMHEVDYEHVDEVQVPNTPVESFENARTIQSLIMPEVHELDDHDMSPSSDPSFSPDFISMPSTTSDEASSHVDMETILEEADEIKEIDDGLLSELDCVGDFSNTQWGSGSNESEKHVDSVGEESLPSANRAESSTTEAVEFSSAELNKAEHEMHLGNSRDEIDIHEEDMEYISDLQTSQTSKDQTIDTSNSTDQMALNSAYYVLNNSDEDNVSRIPAAEMQSKEDIDSFSKKAELKSVETEVMVASAELDRMPELEDIHVVLSNEIEKPVVIEETIAEHSEQGAPHINTNVTDPTHETPILEVRSIEDATLDDNEVTNGRAANHGLPSSVDAILHVVASRETVGIAELHTAETISSEGTSLPAKKVLDGNSEKELKPNTNDESVEVEAEKLGLSVGEESSVKEASSVVAEKPDHEVKATEDKHSDTHVKGKGKISKRSSSSSSSSSESSSSDSD